jgi:hypothetical protein
MDERRGVGYRRVGTLRHQADQVYGIAIEPRHFPGQVGEGLDAQIANLLIRSFDRSRHDANPALHESFVNTETRQQR